MSSNKEKRSQLKSARAKRREKQQQDDLRRGLASGRIVKADTGRQNLNAHGTNYKELYFDREFICVDCGSREVWTARQQQWWYEEAGGYIDSIAVKCRECRMRGKKHGEAHRRAVEERARKRRT
jgi:hypothetical protein